MARTDWHPARVAAFSFNVVERLALHAKAGGGLVAGSSVRNVLQLAGITDVMSKIHSRSRNRLNNARVAIEALKQLKRVSVAVPVEGAQTEEKKEETPPISAE